MEHHGTIHYDIGANETPYVCVHDHGAVSFGGMTDGDTTVWIRFLPVAGHVKALGELLDRLTTRMAEDAAKRGEVA